MNNVVFCEVQTIQLCVGKHFRGILLDSYNNKQICMPVFFTQTVSMLTPSSRKF